MTKILDDARQGWRCHVCGDVIAYGATHTTHGPFIASNKTMTDPYSVSELAAEERAEDERGRLLARIAELETERDYWEARFHEFYALIKRHHDGAGAALVKYAANENRKDTE